MLSEIWYARVGDTVHFSWPMLSPSWYPNLFVSEASLPTLRFRSPLKLPEMLYGASYFELKLKVGLNQSLSWPHFALISLPNLQVSF